MTPAEVAALGVIRATYEEPIEFHGNGDLSELGKPIMAVPTMSDANGAFAIFKKMFAIAFGALPERPVKNDLIIHGDDHWRVIEARDAPDVGEWQVYVEKASK